MVSIEEYMKAAKYLFNTIDDYRECLETLKKKINCLNQIINIPEKQYIVEYNLYVLLLDEEAIYVGRTIRDVSVRLKEHQKGIGAEFTKIYKYGKIEKLIDFSYHSDDRYLDIETNLAFSLMKEFGYKNVRGGTFNKVVYKKDPTKNQDNLDKYPDYTVDDYVMEIKDIIKNKYPKSKLLKN